jgi:hypothetical protein
MGRSWVEKQRKEKKKKQPRCLQCTQIGNHMSMRKPILGLLLPLQRAHVVHNEYIHIMSVHHGLHPARISGVLSILSLSEKEEQRGSKAPSSSSPSPFTSRSWAATMEDKYEMDDNGGSMYEFAPQRYGKQHQPQYYRQQ